MTGRIGAAMIALAFLANTVAGAQTRIGGNTGGVQLDIDPRSAEVYVDGGYVGLIRDFSGYYKHLELAAGPHFIMIIARNYEPLILPVMVAPGGTLPIRGTLSRAYGR
jgi:hypothetical protein